MIPTVTETEIASVASPAASSDSGNEQRVLHVAGFLDRFRALASAAATTDGAGS